MTHPPAKAVTRREFLKRSTVVLSSVAAGPLIFSSPAKQLYAKRSYGNAKKVIILGMDGVDPNLLQRFISEGHLPTFKQALDSGYFGKLRTTNPPHSPVAWSSFITGTNPGGNGIFDFVHRDPKTFTPYMSTSRSFDAKKSVNWGKWKIPLGAGTVELMRKGRPFWNVLEDHGIPSTVFQIPANFPVEPSDVKAVSGMGTPDLLGTYGTFTYFTEEPWQGDPKPNGGRIVRIYPLNHTVSTSLSGPTNPFKKKKEASAIPFTVQRDPQERVVRIAIQDQQFILKEGEFSEWIPISFELIEPFAAVGGMVRFYVKQVHPYLKIYVSPINIDPLSPSLPICSPGSYSREISEAVGRFYTQGFPSDSKVLSARVFTDDEYLAQAKIVVDESMRNYEHLLNQFSEGVFFFYFSSIDQNSHMLWKNMDPTHPLYNPDASPEVKSGVLYFYKKMDQALKMALAKADGQTDLYALSDHGFSPFKREFNLSTWLVQEGFTALTDPTKLGQGEFYDYVDWGKTKAYALGINGIYLNLEGREKRGWVQTRDAQQIKDQIRAKLRAVTDPETGKPIIVDAYDGLEIYQGPFVGLAPDIVVGYQGGYRISDESVLGKFPKEIITNRTDPWAADHCIDPSVVPGFLLSNRKWSHPNPGLWDMAPTILSSFGVPIPAEMEGRVIV